ncbi:MAG: hypothetical protein LBC94_08495 [Desulfovibrio sp.]|jgi:hypothetical protein|nr:hypothetical protein [Desulfovibrio sp.]
MASSQFTSRPDLTPYLLHFTKSKGDSEAFDVLKQILKDGVLKKSKPEIEDENDEVVCFMDVPFHALKYILKGSNREQYDRYGVFIGKKLAYDRGVRPVAYMPCKEKRRMPKEEQWRVVGIKSNMADKGIARIHEREWRFKGNFRLPPEKTGVLVRNADDYQKLQEIITKGGDEYKVSPQAIIPLQIVCQGLFK